MLDYKHVDKRLAGEPSVLSTGMERLAESLFFSFRRQREWRSRRRLRRRITLIFPRQNRIIAIRREQFGSKTHGTVLPRIPLSMSLSAATQAAF